VRGQMADRRGEEGGRAGRYDVVGTQTHLHACLCGAPRLLLRRQRLLHLGGGRAQLLHLRLVLAPGRG
jgi:hypothetical protein